ncbi:lysophosphatidylcholine acyltransferase 2-like isoform X1 [Ruditapes philippinarum]|uniref:lysophosphatidylcholine acyltransferase 2-like isoform X1 n=2 Tax=Ruditapes philippinarum TaxID=129788 RepID=UPI00295ADD3D|nr:lysophosphatidylcholine acyltransferase 2-like isoform X1 [Ruditapes philippinarum]
MKREIPRQQSLIVPEIQNPFVHKVHLGYLDMIQVAFMSVTIAPLRLLLVGISLLLAWPLAALAVSFRSKEEQNQPLSGWRKIIGTPCLYLGRFMTFCIGFQNMKIKGKRVTSSDAPVICGAPHSSFFDVLTAFYCLELPSFVSRAENNEMFLISALLKFTQPVLVKREDPNSRQNTVKEIQNRAQAGGWPQILIFPEGTCTNRSCLISFKLGAFHPGVPVQPVCLRYPNRLDTVTWTWEGPGVFTLLWLTLCQFNTRLEIEYLPVYTPSEEEKADPKLFANNVRKVMAEALGVPVTDHTYDDCRLMMKARKLNLPMESGLVEFQKLHKKLGISVDDMHTLLEKFSSIDLQGKGVITVSEFSKYLQVPESQSLKDVFAMYDRDGSGSIDFREYVIGLSLISAPVNTDSTISLAFQLFDSSKQGYISEEDLSHILYNSFAMLDVDVAELFKQIDADEDGKITYGEFKAFAEKRPEYAAVFMAYQELKKDDTNGNATTETEGHVKSE